MRQCAAVLALCGTTAPASAQETGWSYDPSSYRWFPDTVTKADTPYGTAESKLDVGDALKALDFGVMLSGAAHRGRWAFTGDLVHLDLTADARTPLGVFYSGGRRRHPPRSPCVSSRPVASGPAVSSAGGQAGGRA